MRQATAIGIVLAVLMGLVSLTHFGTLASSIQGSLSAGPLNDYVGFWPILVVLLVLGMVVAFALGAASRR